MKKFENLEYCDLSGMVIERVPREFINDKMKIFVAGDENARLHHPSERKGLLLYDTKLLCQPISLFTHEKEFKEESTPGIAISPKDCFIDNEIVKLQIWDFGGQEIMHSMHRFFLTERTLYVIVVNARDNTQDERAQYWLNNIKSFANGCPVIIVLNKMDQNPSATLNERLLKNDYPQIADIIKFSALNDNKELFSDLVNRILKLVRTFDSYAMDFPISWNQVKTTLTEMEENYIIDPQYRKVCLDNDVDDEQIQNWLLDWFHDLGISFNYHRKDQLLAGYMVLKPEWIRYKTFLSECEYEFPVVSVDERELFTDIRIYDTVLLRNERETQITHIVVKVQK